MKKFFVLFIPLTLIGQLFVAMTALMVWSSVSFADFELAGFDWSLYRLFAVLAFYLSTYLSISVALDD